MMRRPDRVVVTAFEAVRALREAKPDMGPLEMLDEIRYVFHPRHESVPSVPMVEIHAFETGVWKKLTSKISILRAIGFTFCQLTEAVETLRRELRGWKDRDGVVAPKLPPCTCRYCA